MNMRPDQIQDFYKNFLRHMQYEGDLPTELREELVHAKQIALNVTPNLFSIQFIDEAGVHKAYQFKITDPNNKPIIERATGNWELVP